MTFENKHTVAFHLTRKLKEMDIPVEGWLEFVRSRNNDAFSDHAKVFCKVLPPNYGRANIRRELQFTNEFGNQIPLFTPLHDQLIEFHAAGAIRYATAWKWEPNIIPATLDTLDENIVQTMAEQLTVIHRLPKREWMPHLTHDALDYTINKRISYGRENGASEEHIQLLDKLFTQLLPATKFNFMDTVPNHGDCHAKNFIKAGEGYRWTDFESIRLAPREWDMANLSLMTRRLAGKNELWDIIHEVFDAEKKVEDELVHLFEIMKAISTSSYMLMHPMSQHIFKERVEALEPLLTGGDFPVRFPAYSSTLP